MGIYVHSALLLSFGVETAFVVFLLLCSSRLFPIAAACLCALRQCLLTMADAERCISLLARALFLSHKEFITRRIDFGFSLCCLVVASIIYVHCECVKSTPECRKRSCRSSCGFPHCTYSTHTIHF